MKNNLKKNYYSKANDLFERLLDEQSDDPETDAKKETEEKEQNTVEIYYNNLNEETRDILMNALRESLNAAKDDKIATRKIEEALSKEPLVTLISDELVRKLKIEI